MKRIFRRNVTAAAAFVAIALSGTAWAVDEVEPNHPIQTAQPLIIPASVATGNYYVIAKSDNGSVIVETSETNNTRTMSLRINP